MRTFTRCSAFAAACLLSYAGAVGSELVAYDRYNLPYLDTGVLRELLGEDRAREVGDRHERRLVECDEKWDPIIEELYVPGYVYHLEAEESRDECLSEAVHRTAREVLGPSSSDEDEEWFTCAAPTLLVCVEYRIRDPEDRRSLMGKCGHRLLPGRQCPVDGPRCKHHAPGRTSVTYGGLRPAAFRQACLANRGEYSCYGQFC